MPSLPNPFKSDHYKPEAATSLGSLDNTITQGVGYLMSEFEPFQLNPQHGWKGRGAVMKDEWDIVVPKHAPPVPPGLSDVFDRVLKSSWKVSEPAAGAARDDHGFVIGTRNKPIPITTLTQTYHPQVRPVRPDIQTALPNKDAIASDWKVVNTMERTNAVAFRRPPVEVVLKYKGFQPPVTRPDAWYLENAVFPAFADYLDRRYKRKIAQKDFLAAVRGGAPSAADQKLLVEYTTWRQITVREAAHIGRMGRERMSERLYLHLQIDRHVRRVWNSQIEQVGVALRRDRSRRFHHSL